MPDWQVHAQNGKEAMSKLIFYTNPMSRGRIVRWMLEETGTEYETRVIEYGEEMKSPSYTAINPMGKVPALSFGKQVITESAAICAWLADAFPAANLAPPPKERADYYRWLFFAAGPLEQAMVNGALGVQLTEEQEAMAGYGNYDRTVEVLAAALADRDCIAGERFSAADVYVGAHVIWGLQTGSLPKLPAFEAYAEKQAARPAWKRVEELEGPMQ